MKKILLFLLLFVSFAFSAIDECKTDVYFGNGILTESTDAEKNAGILDKSIKKKFGLDYYKKHIGKVDYAYNRTDGAIMDLLESLIQKDEGVGLGELNKYVKVAKTLAGLATQKAHDSDLSRQITQYKESIKNGHKVLLVAHSQGNLFGYEAYSKLDGWMQDYFEAVSVATPMNSDIKSGTPRINWDNDLVAYLAFGNSGWVDNPVRKIGWHPLRALIGLTYREKRPDDAYAYEHQVGGKSPKGDWQSSEDYLSYRSMAGVLGGLDHLVHAFTFYMGKPLAEKNYFGSGDNGTSGSSNDNNTSTGDDNSTAGGSGTDDNATGGGTDTNTTTLKSLKLTIAETTLNKDHNSTLTLKATYDDNTTKTPSNIAWLINPKDAVAIKGTTLTAIKDSNVTIQAKVGNTLSNQVKLTIYWEVNGYRLPPEPDPKVNNATLLGVDVNHNGVRDDVERWIYNRYKDKHPIHIDIAMQAARGYRLILEKQPKTREEAKRIMGEVEASLYCELYYRSCVDKEYEGRIIDENDEIDSRFFRHKIYFNTQERMDFYIKYDTLLSGDTYTLIRCSKRKKLCDFNTSKYEE